MISNVISRICYVRQTGISTINFINKHEYINSRCKNFPASAIAMYNTESGRNKDYDSRKSRNKSQGPSTVYRDPVRQVLISQSNDVFTNLALEDWLYKHHDFDHKVRSYD